MPGQFGLCKLNTEYLLDTLNIVPVVRLHSQWHQYEYLLQYGLFIRVKHVWEEHSYKHL